MELFKASNQWASRPTDERFWGPKDARAAAESYMFDSGTARVNYADLRVEADGGDMLLIGKSKAAAKLTNYAFGQIAAKAHAPAEYLRGLPGTLAAQNINHGLKHRAGDGEGRLLIHKTDRVARCITGVNYKRVWNAEVFARCEELEAEGWRVPPARPAGTGDPRMRPATEEECGWCGDSGLSVRPGDIIAPAGAYVSDRDMFAFMVHPERVLKNPADKGTPLLRGFMVSNSEVGDKVFWLVRFLLDAVCGNHIVWGAQQIEEIRVKHVGEAREKTLGRMVGEVRKYADDSAKEDQAKLEAAQDFVFADKHDDAVTKVISLSKRGKLGARNVLSANIVEAAVTTAINTPRYGNPYSAWGIASGLTEVSQGSDYTSQRVAIDTAAGRLIEMSA